MANYTSRHSGEQLDAAADLSGILYATDNSSVDGSTSNRTQWKLNCKASETTISLIEKNASGGTAGEIPNGTTILYKVVKAPQDANGTTIVISLRNNGSETVSTEHPVIGADLTPIKLASCPIGSALLLSYDSAVSNSVKINGTVTSITGCWRVIGGNKSVADLSGVVHTTGNETIGGDKTFTGLTDFSNDVYMQNLLVYNIYPYGENTVTIKQADLEVDGNTTIHGYAAIYDDGTASSDVQRPVSNFDSDDMDIYLYNTGITAYDANGSNSYKLSYPAETGTFATQEWVLNQAEELDADTIYDALGYIPVNKAGDTFDGDVYFQTSPITSLIGYGASITKDASDKIVFSTYHSVRSSANPLYGSTVAPSGFTTSYSASGSAYDTSYGPGSIQHTSRVGFDTEQTYTYSFPENSGILATQEWVTANAGGAKNIKDETPTGALSQLKDGTTFTFTNPNSTRTGESITIGATGQYATSLGGKSKAEGKRAVAEGTSTIAQGQYSHVEGNASISVGVASHAEGLQTVAQGDRAHTEGQETLAVGSNAHAEGYSTVANSYSSHTEGAYTKTGVSDRNGIVQWVSMSAGSFTVAEAAGKTLSIVSASVSRGTISTNVESGSNYIRYVISNAGTVDDSHKVLVRIVYAINGSTPTPPGPTPDPSVDSGNTLNHAEGYMTQAFGAAAHSEGHTTAALGQYSHAEGIGNVAFGLASHVEGADNEANGKYSHAGGSLTKVNGMNSIAVGGGLKSNADNQAIFGKYNLDDTSAFVIGNGNSDNNRTDLFKVNETGVYYKNAKLSTSDDLAVIKGAGTASFKTSNSTVANQGSAAIGYSTTATAWGSLSFGASTKATQSYAVAGGQASEANAEHSFAFGEVVKTTNQYQVAFGKYNAMKSGTVFEIGYGTSSNRENVFEVHADGHAEVKSGMKIVNGNLQIGNTTLSEAQLQKILALVAAMDVRDQ